MSLKKSILASLKDPSKRREIFFISAKNVFIAMAFVFFTGYFLFAAGIGENYLGWYLGKIYICFVVSYSIFMISLVHFVAYKKIPNIAIWGISTVLILLGFVFLYPIL